MTYVVGGNEVYQQQASWPVVLEHNNVVVIWSASLLNTLKIAQNVSDEHSLDYVAALRKSSNRLICIDPMSSESFDFFGDKMEWIAHTLVENGWQDEAFLAYCATGYSRHGASQGVTLLPFAAFWRVNRLLEMPENPVSTQFVR